MRLSILPSAGVLVLVACGVDPAPSGDRSAVLTSGSPCVEAGHACVDLADYAAHGFACPGGIEDFTLSCSSDPQVIVEAICCLATAACTTDDECPCDTACVSPGGGLPASCTPRFVLTCTSDADCRGGTCIPTTRGTIDCGFSECSDAPPAGCTSDDDCACDGACVSPGGGLPSSCTPRAILPCSTARDCSPGDACIETTRRRQGCGFAECSGASTVASPCEATGHQCLDAFLHQGICPGGRGQHDELSCSTDPHTIVEAICCGS